MPIIKKKTVPFNFKTGNSKLISPDSNFENVLYALEQEWQGSALSRTNTQLSICNISLDADTSTPTITYLMTIPLTPGLTTTYYIMPDEITAKNKNDTRIFVYDIASDEITQIYNRVNTLYGSISTYLKCRANPIDSVVVYLQKHYDEYKLQFYDDGFIQIGDNFKFREYPNPCLGKESTYFIKMDNLTYYIASDEVHVKETVSKGISNYINYTGNAEILHSNAAQLHQSITIENIKKYNWQLRIRPRLLWSLVGGMATSFVILLNTCTHSQKSQEKQNTEPKTEITSDTTQCRESVHAFKMYKDATQQNQNQLLQKNK